MHIGIIAKLNGEKTELSARIEKINRTIVLLRELDGPSELSEQDPGEPPELKPPVPKAKTKRKNTKKKPVKPKKPKLTRGQRNFKPTGSTKKNKRSYGTNEYEGVKKLEPYKDGRPRFSASIRIPGTKKMEYLGIFDSAKKASDARSKAAADMADQAENNQDRPPKRNNKKTVFVCMRCGTKYQSKGLCGCGCNDMREVPV